MKRLQKLLADKAAAIAEMRTILDKADEEKRDMTEDETKRYELLDKSIDTLNAEIEREQKLAGLEAGNRGIVNPFPVASQPAGTVQVNDPDKFRNLGEYFHALAYNKSDPRLVALREQSMGTGTGGGYAIPDQFRPELMQVQPQDAIVRPRATVIPAGTPPDSAIYLPALDQTSGANVYGGVTVTHTGEGATMTETSLKLKEIKLEPHEITAYITATDKLLNNWDAAAAVITTQLRKAMVGAEDYDFLRGDGVAKALGITNAPAAIEYSRAGANAVAWADVYGMFARARMGGSLVWLASQTIIPQLAAMVDAGSHAVWIGGGNLAQGASAAMPGTLMGIPLIFCDRLPALGTKGDLILADLAYYLVKDGSGPRAAISEHVYFTSNKTVFKIVWSVDGQPWLTEPLGLEGATTSTVSPFVILK